ncbi:acyl-CoA dehydrogenase family protein [Shewanella glacialipiscicola]|uniref:Acyl-CoA dehydrogenase n=1 Tax=Shewanella glacialipiscicola TaxID=614069 RepID=A0ABQ6J384_9GAMM|nr:acyl-CoA dehydrogenase family protein [Shewanella glacialipiscicola]MCL1087440.1 acyl-CoA dehydrogenase family protein [Shewanella glacialipiscicola]MCU7995480.1 acyl-CoA dehydrogenase family protein [Shewanella glacialipiscicola]MCU8026727.1 acyl-CoA dehydrogenase family protein [Shewanella glacialipiscicola]GIU11793.1 acyl-CoA dehydrogenase [Shewanella glacialipiscicola]GMA82184.1 acyl-CoA dehydrogenase [Shewanella glacialipiscicola]
MADIWTKEDENSILDMIAKWVDNEVRPIAQEYDQQDKYPADLVEQMKELGLFGATISQDYGGMGLPVSIYAKIVMKVSSAWMAPGGIFNSHLIQASAIERSGTEAQKEQFLARMASGELRGGVALTEPNAGTDLQAIRSTAVRDGDDYIINGSKTWITNSLNGNSLAVLVKTDLHAKPAHKGTSLFIVETKDEQGNFKAGITVSKMKKMGYRAIDTCEVTFEDFRVPAANLIGGVEGKGFLQAIGGLELGRINVAARGAGIAQGAMELAVRYAQERETFGKPICQHQAIQLKLGEMATKVEASRLLIEQAAAKYDAGERCDMEAGMAKYAGSEAGVFCANEAMRIFGGFSYSVEYEIERFYRDAMLMCIGEGTNEMQRIIIAKQLVERYKI